MVLKYNREGLKKVKERARANRRMKTPAEALFRTLLRRHREERVFRQYPIGNCIIDFAIPRRNLLVEIDGSSHDGKPAQDERRDAWLKSRGFHVIRLRNEEIIESPNTVLGRIDGFPKSDENKTMFFSFSRAARSVTFWERVDMEKHREIQEENWRLKKRLLDMGEKPWEKK